MPEGDEEFTELPQFEIHPPSVRLLPESFCKRNDLVVLGEVEEEQNAPVTIGMLDPEQEDVQYRVADILQHPVECVRLNQYEIAKVLEEAYGPNRGSGGEEVIHDRFDDRRPSDAEGLVQKTLCRAVEKGASDIHLERYQEDVDLRFRIDGLLHQMYTDISPANIDQVVNRIKVMAELDITEQQAPQDGRFQRTIVLDDRGEVELDFRVSVIPCPTGEEVVIRVLDAEAGLIPLEQLGMTPEVEKTFLRLLKNPEGLILVTGPTGSGKTTTLYAALQEINDGRRKIITAEDPIEYRIDKINQKEVTEEMPLPVLLRALLRQDPDVMLIGEVRDQVTGNTALAAANTGHVVFGTVHTPDAIGTITRLRGLELDDSELSDALLAVLNQRLVRRVCTECSEPALPSDQQLDLFGPPVQDLMFKKGTGCEACRHTGYDGRVGLFELLVVDRDMQEMLAEGVHVGALRDHARSKDHRLLLHDALEKVEQGLTTLEELERIIPYRQIRAYQESQA